MNTHPLPWRENHKCIFDANNLPVCLVEDDGARNLIISAVNAAAVLKLRPESERLALEANAEARDTVISRLDAAGSGTVPERSTIHTMK